MQRTVLGLLFPVVGVCVTAGTFQSTRVAAPDDLRSADSGRRITAVCAVKAAGTASAAATAALAELLTDSTPVEAGVCDPGHGQWRRDDGRMSSIGREAASALAAVGGGAFDPLARALTHTNRIARANAAFGLGALDDRRGVEPLLEALGDPHAEVRREAAWALGAIGASAGVDALLGALRDDEAKVRAQAAWALGAIGDDRAAEGLTAALGDKDVKVRRQAAWALGAVTR
jgi:HEAT repeat protein